MQLIINGLIAGSLAALIAGGLALVYGVMGIFNLALGQMALIGGYSAWWLHQSLGLPLWISVPGGLLIGATVAWISFEIFINPFYKRHRFFPLVTTIALSMIFDGLILLLFEESPKTITPGMQHTWIYGGIRITIQQVSMVALTILVLCLFAYVFHSTAFGRKIRAVVQQDSAAMSLGISAPFLHRFVFIMSGILAACGGIFMGIDTNLSPTLAFAITIKAYAAIIAGGKGNIWGAIVFAYMIALLEQLVVGIHWFGIFYIPSGYQNSVALLFIIIFLLLQPLGITGSRLRTA